MRSALIWAAALSLAFGPLLLAAGSPYLAFRQPIYIAAGFAGIAAMGLLLLQPLLAHRVLTGLPKPRRVHAVLGALIIALITLHVGGLWITSPPDVIDALTFRSPTPFSVWGVLALWAALAAAFLAARRRALRPKTWRRGHLTLGAVIALGTAAHALLIEGTMEPMSKAALAAALAWASLWAAWRSRLFSR